MPDLDIVVSNKLGLHARAAAKLTQLAGKFSSEIFISKGAQRVNATVKVEANGSDADQALDAIQKLFDDKFGEGE